MRLTTKAQRLGARILRSSASEEGARDAGNANRGVMPDSLPRMLGQGTLISHPLNATKHAAIVNESGNLREPHVGNREAAAMSRSQADWSEKSVRISRAFSESGMLIICGMGWWVNGSSSTTPPTRSKDCNLDAMAGFVPTHGLHCWENGASSWRFRFIRLWVVGHSFFRVNLLNGVAA